MKPLLAFILCLLLSAGTFSQDQPVLRLKGTVAFPGSIVRHKLLDDGRRLLLVGDGAVKLLDTETAEVLEYHSIRIPSPRSDQDWVVSPDGRKMFVLGPYDYQAKAYRQASVWDLQTGEKIAALDNTPNPIVTGYWSKNGRTLFTYDNEDFPSGPADEQNHAILFSSRYNVGVTFWDGDTFARLSTLLATDLTWWYLTSDGERFVFASGARDSFFGLKYLAHRGDAVSVWKTRGGRIEQTVITADDYYLSATKKISISPDGSLLAFVQKNRSKLGESKLTVRELDGLRLKYEVKDPRISSSTLRFSPDGKYLAVDAGKGIHIYEVASGEKRYELPDADPPDLWLADDRFILNNEWDKMKVFAVDDGRKVYEQKMLWKTERRMGGSFLDSNGNFDFDWEYETVDHTQLAAQPGGKMVMTYSNQYVKVLDARTGALLQLIVSPPVDYSKKPPKVSKTPLVKEANWSGDGKTLYVINHDADSVALWSVL